MGKVLNSKGIIQKRNYIEKRLKGNTYGKETARKRNYMGGDYIRKGLNGEIIIRRMNDIGEGTTWGRELHGEGITQREGTEWGRDDIDEVTTRGRHYTERGN